MEEEKETSQKKQNYSEIFAAEREQWKSNIEEFSSMIMNISQIPALQVQLFSSLAKIADYRKKLSAIYSKRDYVYKEKVSRAVEKIANSPLKYSAPEKKHLLDSETKDDALALESLNDHIEFLSDIYSILDKMVYSIKYRVEIESYKSEI